MDDKKGTILIIDDQIDSRSALTRGLGGDYEVFTATDAESAQEVLRRVLPDMVILDSGKKNRDLLPNIQAVDPKLWVIMLTSHEHDEFEDKAKLEELKGAIQQVVSSQDLRREVALLRSELFRKYSFGNLVSNNPRMQQIFHMLERTAQTNATILIQGESGTGKELIARSIHYSSPRRDKPFVQVNCAAIPETLIESELFGHERGAFTGAMTTRIGKFELANGGTLFLDEIGDMAMSTQAKVLRALQEREFERVGGSRTIKVDVRIVAATNRNLKEAVSKSLFREDLYYRLHVVPIVLLPLRERREDIPLLVESFIGNMAREFGRPVKAISREALAVFLGYGWPGNVRQLENAVKRMVLVANSGTLEIDDIPSEIIGETLRPGDEAAGQVGLKEIGRYAESMAEAESLKTILTEAEWNISRAAKMLGVTRKTLYRKIKDYRIERPQKL